MSARGAVSHWIRYIVIVTREMIARKNTARSCCPVCNDNFLTMTPPRKKPPAAPGTVTTPTRTSTTTTGLYKAQARSAMLYSVIWSTKRTTTTTKNLKTIILLSWQPSPTGFFPLSIHGPGMTCHTTMTSAKCRVVVHLPPASQD